jgi:alpha-N-arabinofuranosidase
MRVTGIGALLLVGLSVALLAEGPLPNQESLRRTAHEIKLRNFSAAERLLGEVLKKDPRSFVGHNLMGLMRLSEGNVAIARQAFEQQLWLSFDEWNVWYRKNTEADMNGRGKEAPHLVEEVYNLEDALVVGGLIITLLRHSDRVRLACLAQLVNDIAPLVTNADGVLRQTIYYPYAWALKYGRGNALNLAVESETYEVPEIGRVPYVDIAGTFDPEGGSTTLFILNRDLIKAREVEVMWRESAPTRVGECQVMTGADLKAYNSFEAPKRVIPQPLERPKPGARMTFELPAHSYTLAHLPG